MKNRRKPLQFGLFVIVGVLILLGEYAAASSLLLLAIYGEMISDD